MQGDFATGYDHRIDGAGRINLPAQHRRAVPGGSLWVVQLHRDFLTLYTAEGFEALKERLTAYRLQGPKQARAYRKAFGSATPLEVDATGRVLIPKKLREKCGLAGIVKVLGAGNRIELWNLDRYNEVVGDDFEDVDIPEDIF
ncbi:MAG: hypothetical protein J4G12_02555 [Gemmatimonadetes bacterium]|nr:hypothetical protein [Gemmatimonadota bacterium]